MSQAAKNVEVLEEIDFVQQLGCILETNVRAAKSLGHVYVGQVNLSSCHGNFCNCVNFVKLEIYMNWESVNMQFANRANFTLSNLFTSYLSLQCTCVHFFKFTIFIIINWTL